MGLDNGILIRGKSLRAKQLMEKMFKELNDKYSPEDYDFCYWRKCWNMRQRMFETFKEIKNGEDSILTLQDLRTFVKDVLQFFLIEENWTHYEYDYEFYPISIWEWYEMVPNIASSIRDLRIFLGIVDDIGYNDDDFAIVWYDSY